MASGVKQDIERFEVSYQNYVIARTNWRRAFQDPAVLQPPDQCMHVQALFEESMAAYKTFTIEAYSLLGSASDKKSRKEIAGVMLGAERLWNRQAKKQVNQITRWLRSNAMRELDLPKMEFMSGRKFLPLLASNTSLTFLNLSRHVRKIEQIAGALRFNSSLVAVDLSHNQIRGEEAKELLKALQSNSTLTWLNLRDNCLCHVEEPDLRMVLLSHPTLTWLSLQENSINHVDWIKPLGSNTSLVSLDLAGNSLGDPAAADLGASLVSNTTLTSLNLRSNYVGDQGVDLLARALHSNTALRMLHLTALHFDPVSLMALDRMYDVNGIVVCKLDHSSADDPRVLRRVLDKGERNRWNNVLRQTSLVQLLLGSLTLERPAV